MLLIILVSLIFIALIVAEFIYAHSDPYHDTQAAPFMGLILAIFIGTSFMSKYTSNPSIEEYVSLKEEYDYVCSKDSIPFNIKKGIYEELNSYNESVKDNKTYKDNIFIGFYYPEIGTLPVFDLSKIK